MPRGTEMVTLGSQYFSIGMEILGKSKDSGNPHVLLLDNSEDILEKYVEQTKWSDFNVLVPSLFNIIHGTELLVKGIILKCGGTPKQSHSIDFNGLILEPKYAEFQKMVVDLENLSGDCPIMLIEFAKATGVTKFSQLYEALRYPLNKDFSVEKEYYTLRYTGSDGVPKIKSLHAYFEKLHELMLILYREIF